MSYDLYPHKNILRVLPTEYKVARDTLAKYINSSLNELASNGKSWEAADDALYDAIYGVIGKPAKSLDEADAWLAEF
jgi:hypothetical protein